MFISDNLTKKIQLFNNIGMEFDFSSKSFTSFLKLFVKKWKHVQTNGGEAYIDHEIKISKNLDGVFMQSVNSENGGMRITLEIMKKFLRMKKLLIKSARVPLNKM